METSTKNAGYGDTLTTLKKEILLSGSTPKSHPVLDKLGLARIESKPQISPADISEHRLTVLDARQSTPEEWAKEGSSLQIALQQKKPVLTIAPTEKHLQSIKNIAVLPKEACQALLIHPFEKGDTQYHVEVLSEPTAASVDTIEEAESQYAIENGGTPPKSEATTPTITEDSEPALDQFVNTVTKSMEGKLTAVASQNNPPTGLKYFKQTINISNPFTYNYDGAKNGPGSLAIRYTVWGFLEQTASANSQFLIVEASNVMNPGSLHNNKDTDRGYATAYLTGALKPPLNHNTYVPASSMCNNFTGSVDVPISYKNPTGGYQVWNFQSNISDSADDWCVKSASSGNSLGSTWYMKSPVDGTNVKNDWKDAFSFWGHVDGLPGSSTGSLDVDDIGVWQTNTLLNGTQYIAGSYSWQGARFFGSSCSPGVCWKINAAWITYTWSPGFNVDFSTIQPS